MKMFSFLALAAVAALPVSAFAGGNCTTVVAPTAASPAAAAPAVAQNNQGYRSYSYQPGVAAPAANYNYGGYRRGNSQPMWSNGANKALGRYN